MTTDKASRAARVPAQTAAGAATRATKAKSATKRASSTKTATTKTAATKTAATKTATTKRAADQAAAKKAARTSTTLVAGGSGFVGSHVVARLLADGRRVVVMSRDPQPRDDGATARYGDVLRPDSLAAALDGVDTAVFLVHSLDHGDFEERDRQGATNFARAAADAGVRRVVYLGGLGADGDDLSPHLRSRREVERLLAEHVDTVSLRAAIVVGHGSISWEMLCQLVERLPAMITPKWVDTATQPIALADVVQYVIAALDTDRVPAGSYEIGAPRPTTYREMMRVVARLMHRPLPVMPVPMLSPKLSSMWLRAITDVDMPTAGALVESLVNPVVVHDRRIEELTGHRAMTFVDAAVAALTDRIKAAAEELAGE